MSGDTKRVLEVNQIDNLQGSTQRVKQETTLNNLRGVTQRVYVVGGGGSTPVIDELNVTPSTSAQTITAPEGVDGYSPVNVSAVDNTIDANIVAGNIKKDVQILGVTGSYEGQTPTGTMYIISNGTYNVADKAIANVQVPTTAPAHYIEKAVDANGKLMNSANIINLNGVTDVGDYALYSAYYENTSISGAVDMSDLTTISGSYACQTMFNGCTGITSIDLSGLTTVSGQSACNSMFSVCTGITSVDLSSLTTVSGHQACQIMFSGCTGLISVDLSGLTTLSGAQACSSMFYGCNRITSVDLSGLTTLSGAQACSSMFRNCTSLTTLSFPALTSIGSFTNQFNDMLRGVTGCTVHFPSNLQSVIGSWASVTAGFTGTNTTVLFDLPATNTLTGVDTVTYTRNPKYDTGTALAWKVGAYGTTNFTPAYYTSGLTDPTVGTTIYSDAGCTIAVTTVYSIA